MKIKYVDLTLQTTKIAPQLVKIFKQVVSSGQFVGGKYVNDFEKKMSKYLGVNYCVALNSGTDALTFAMHSLGIKKNDEIITPPNSFIASTAAIIHLGAKPVFVDVLKDQNIDCSKIENCITKKTKAIMPVHLTGRPCEMNKIMKIAKKYNLKVIEDAAQSIGTKYKSKKVGTFGDIGCFSAHPLKNLNALGDAGYLVTNNKKIYKKIKDLSNHGMTNRNIISRFGYVSRMDSLQASFLTYKLKNLNTLINKRRKNYELYKKNLDKKNVYFPDELKDQYNSYHTFVIHIKNRDKLKKFLLKKKIETSIHYPVPIHLQPASKFLGYKKGDFPEAENQSKNILTLPIHQDLTKKNIFRICKTINSFYN